MCQNLWLGRAGGIANRSNTTGARIGPRPQRVILLYQAGLIGL